MTRAKRSYARWLLLLIPLMLLSGVTVWAWNIVLGENFHEVVPHKLYRSGQPTAASIREKAPRLGIRTIINLQGAHPRREWYTEEAAACESLGIKLIDIQLTATEVPMPQQASMLIHALRDSPQPIWVHCKNGADRSGLASAIFLLLQGATESEARNQLTLRFGHLPFGPTQRMDECLQDFSDRCGG